MNARPLDGVWILFVEDNAMVRDVIEELLVGFGGRVTAVGGAAEALDTLRWARPNVLISDLDMRGENGCSLIQKIRALPSARGGRTPAVCLTGHNSPEDEVRILRAGFQGFLAKPVDARRLVTMVAALAGVAARGATGALAGYRAGPPLGALRWTGEDARQQREETR